MVLRSALDFVVARSWLLLPSTAAGAGAGFAIDGLSPAMFGGAALGLASALAVGLALELRGYCFRTPDDVEGRTELETIAIIGSFKRQPDSALPTGDFPDALRAYEELAVSLRARGGPEVRSLLVTSPGAEEGKSTTAANLATVLADMGHNVILVDGDLRWSSLRGTNPLASSNGLSGLLQNYLHKPDMALVPTHEHNLSLLPAGALPRNSQVLLASPRLGKIIASLREMADYVIVDSPPVLEAEDARLLARNMDATLLVIRARKTRSREVNRALRILMKAGVRPLGAVLNAVPVPKRAPRAAPVPSLEPSFASTISPTASAPNSYAIDQKTLPVGAEVPRPRRAVSDSVVLRLAQEGFGSTAGQERLTSVGDAPAPPPSSQDVPPYLRVVQPDERPLAVTNDWEPMLRRHRVPRSTRAALRFSSEEAGSGDVVAHLEPFVLPPAPEESVEAVLAHMQETLQMIRALRQGHSVTNA